MPMQKFRLNVREAGGGLAVSFPREMRELTGLVEGDVLEINVTTPNRFSIQKMKLVPAEEAQKEKESPAHDGAGVRSPLSRKAPRDLLRGSAVILRAKKPEPVAQVHA